MDQRSAPRGGGQFRCTCSVSETCWDSHWLLLIIQELQTSWILSRPWILRYFNGGVYMVLLCAVRLIRRSAIWDWDVRDVTNLNATAHGHRLPALGVRPVQQGSFLCCRKFHIIFWASLAGGLASWQRFLSSVYLRLLATMSFRNQM